jgi:hypothetical protein
MHRDYYIVYCTSPFDFSNQPPYPTRTGACSPHLPENLFINPICLEAMVPKLPHLLEELDAIFGREMAG